MSMDLTAYLAERLEPTGVTLEELRELTVRLLHHGVLVRAESQVERELYDRFVRIEDIVTESLAVYGLEPYHDSRFEYVRVYPPGSRTPRMDQAPEASHGGSLRSRLSQHEVALVLVLRAQYDKTLREGKVDEHGFATESLEAISLAMKNWLGRSLPEKVLDRRRVFQRLRQLRLIDYHSDEDLEQTEAWLRIHPMIVDFVGTEAIEAARTGGRNDVS
jgi:hypothetical protein